MDQQIDAQACLRPRDRFWDIPVPKIDSAFDNLLVPQPSWSPSTTQQLRKLVAAPYLPPNDWTPRSEAYFVFPLAQGTPGKQCGLAATGVYQPSLRSPWLAANAIVLKVSNGPAEGLNSRIKMIKVRSRGFRNKERFANAIYFHLGGLDLYPDGITR
ncbi:transposase [Thiolapillus sp.]|uniref:transposase n=1 Tax=Thiolapillus sp. TaxID=2017437 RepID=UPI003AF58F8D